VTSAVVTTTSDPLSTFSSFKVSFLATSSSFDPTTTTTLSTTRTTTTTTTPTVSITYTATAPSDPAATAALLFSELTEEVKTLKKWFQGIERDVEIIYQNGVQDDEIIFRHEREIDTLAANLTETVKYVNTFTSMYNDMTHESEDDFKGLYSGVQNVSQRLDVLEFQTNNDLTHFYWTLHSKMERRFAALEVENIELKEKLDEQLCRQPVSTDAVEERLGAIEVENAELKEKLDKLLGQQVVPHGIVEEIPQPVEEHHEEHAEEEAPKEPQPEEQHWPEWFEGEWNGKN
jgi:predicted nuclease with TOPRIM domain